MDRDKQWSRFYEKELDALEWALEFMRKYEKKHDIHHRPKQKD